MIVLQISAPATPEPYQTLSMLHEEMGDSDTAYQVTTPEISHQDSYKIISLPTLFDCMSISFSRMVLGSGAWGFVVGV